MSADIIDCHTASMVGGRDAAQHFTVCRTVLHNKELVQDVSGAKVGKPCSKGNKVS